MSSAQTKRDSALCAAKAIHALPETATAVSAVIADSSASSIPSYTRHVPKPLLVSLIAGCAIAGCVPATATPTTATTPTAPTAPTRVDRRDQLPVHRYVVAGDIGRLVVDATAFAGLARRLRSDVEHDLAAFDIRDPASLKDRLFTLALLDALDDHWTESLARIDRIAAVELEPVAKAMTGLTIRVWADAIANGGDREAFRAALERKLSSMPTDLVRKELSVLRTMGQVFTVEVCRHLVDEEIGRHVASGGLSLEQVQAIAFQRYAVVRLVPVGDIIDRVLGRRGIEPQR